MIETIKTQAKMKKTTGASTFKALTLTLAGRSTKSRNVTMIE